MKIAKPLRALSRWLTERDVRCLFGHLRGVHVGVSFSKKLKVLAEYRCPRCNATWTRQARKITAARDTAKPDTAGVSSHVPPGPAPAVSDPLDHLGAINCDPTIAQKDYRRENAEDEAAIREQQEDDRLNDPRHGQARDINRGRAEE